MPNKSTNFIIRCPLFNFMLTLYHNKRNKSTYRDTTITKKHIYEILGNRIRSGVNLPSNAYFSPAPSVSPSGIPTLQKKTRVARRRLPLQYDEFCNPLQYHQHSDNNNICIIPVGVYSIPYTAEKYNRFL